MWSTASASHNPVPRRSSIQPLPFPVSTSLLRSARLSPRLAKPFPMAESPENAAAPPPPSPSPPPKSGIPPRYDLDAKWDACLDLSIRRVAYSSLAGAFAGLLLFRSPTTRWASVALGAGVGLGAAYIECSYIFNGAPPKLSPKVSTVPSAHSEGEDK